MAVKKAINNNELQKQIEELKNTVALLVNSMAGKAQEKVEADVIVEDTEEQEYKNIPDNKYIKVVSLQNNRMALSTEGFGRGKPYKFTKFGQVKNITYSNLSDIISNQEKFAKQGRFYICDETVINNHELMDTYENILTKEQMENILTYDEKKMEMLFKRTTDPQRETIISLVMTKLNNGEKIDLNKISVLSKICGFDITANISK